MPRHPVVLFDLDGTLADTIGLIVASFQHAFRQVLGQDVAPAVARGWIGRPLLPVLLEMSPEHGVELDRVYREWNLANTARLIKAYAGVPEMLAALREAGVVTGIVTSKRHAPAQLALDCLGLADLIKVTTGLEDTAAHKPDPAPLRHAMASLGVSATQCVYVGDATVDVLAARAAGVSSVAVTWGAGERSDLVACRPDTLVDSVGELTAYLLG